MYFQRTKAVTLASVLMLQHHPDKLVLRIAESGAEESKLRRLQFCCSSWQPPKGDEQKRNAIKSKWHFPAKLISSV